MADLSLELRDAARGTPAWGDLVLCDAGDLQLTSGVSAVQQAVVQAVRQLTKDWFLNLADGLPYREALFGGRDLSSAFEAVLQNRVLQVPGVLGLLTWQAKLDRKNRNLTVTFSARCTGGEVQWSIPVDVA